MKKLKYLSIILLLFNSCSEDEKIYNERSYWTNEEMAELHNMVKVFDNSLVEAYGISIEEAYPKFSNEFYTSIKIKGSFISPLKTEMDINKLKVLDKIWKKVSDSTGIESLELNTRSEYFDYLQRLSSNSVIIKDYMNSFKHMAESKSSHEFKFVEKSKVLNFKDINNRLIFFINFLTLQN